MKWHTKEKVGSKRIITSQKKSKTLKKNMQNIEI